MNRALRAYGRASGNRSGSRRLLQLHDVGIEACHRGELPALMATLEALSALLPHEPDLQLRVQLARLYLSCARAAHGGDFIRPERVLTALRRAWHIRARELMGVDPVPERPEEVL